MANIIIYDTITKKVTKHLRSVDPSRFYGREDVLYNPDLTGIDLNHSVVEDGVIRNQTEQELLDIENALKIKNYQEYRSREYPRIGDQLDAVLKQLNYMQMSGQTNLVTELDGIVGKWLAVKQKYPKPIDNAK